MNGTRLWALFSVMEYQNLGLTFKYDNFWLMIIRQQYRLNFTVAYFWNCLVSLTFIFKYFWLFFKKKINTEIQGINSNMGLCVSLSLLLLLVYNIINYNSFIISIIIYIYIYTHTLTITDTYALGQIASLCLTPWPPHDFKITLIARRYQWPSMAFIAL